MSEPLLVDDRFADAYRRGLHAERQALGATRDAATRDAATDTPRRTRPTPTASPSWPTTPAVVSRLRRTGWPRTPARLLRRRRGAEVRGRRAVLRDAMLAEWEFFGGPAGLITMAGFAQRMGMSLAAWDRMFLRARAAGDPRAQRPTCEHPARFTRAEILAQWEALGGPAGLISHTVFAGRMGMSYTGWKAMFYRAHRAGDPRAQPLVSAA